MRSSPSVWHVPLALVTGAAIATNPHIFPPTSRPLAAPTQQPVRSAIEVTGASRDIVAGLAFSDFGPESPELRALRLAELQMFAEEPPGDDRAAGWGDEDDSAPREYGQFAGTLEGMNLPDLGVRSHPMLHRYIKYFTDDDKGRSIFRTWLSRSGRFRPVIHNALRTARLPTDLEALVFIESGFWPTAKSPAGAVGLWQFMPETARAYGLSVGRDYDERRSIWRSSEAAASHLSDLYAHFKSWDLALAAYNFGYRNVHERMERAEVTDFWALAEQEGGLPTETRRYVPKVMAVAVILKNLDRFGFDEVSQAAALDAVAFEVPPGTSMKALARAAGLSGAELRQMNPEFISALVPDRGGPVAVHIPRSGLARAKAMLPHLLGGQLDLLAEGDGAPQDDWEVGIPDDTAQRLARTNPPKNRANRSDADLVTPLTPPSTALMSIDEKPKASEPLVSEAPKATAVALSLPIKVADEPVTFLNYRVEKGDTLERIAERHGVTQGELLVDNHLRHRAVIYRGQTLRIRDAKQSPKRKTLAYRIRRGDTLSTIAMQLEDDAREIATENGITNPNLIRIGQIVFITPS
jgi:membrane-bound lytic murein transglycosylase D